MIRTLKRKDYPEIWGFIRHNIHPDFYITENNQRVFITSNYVFKKLIRQSNNIYIADGKDMNGIILVWKGVGGKKSRNYIKITASNKDIATRLLTVLLWNFNNDLYIKIKKASSYLQIFKEKRFIFLGGRGREILLYKKRK